MFFAGLLLWHLSLCFIMVSKLISEIDNDLHKTTGCAFRKLSQIYSSDGAILDSPDHSCKFSKRLSVKVLTHTNEKHQQIIVVIYVTRKGAFLQKIVVASKELSMTSGECA